MEASGNESPKSRPLPILDAGDRNQILLCPQISVDQKTNQSDFQGPPLMGPLTYTIPIPLP